MAIALTLCVGGLDIQVAEFIRDHLRRRFLFSHAIAHLPDLLLVLVIVVGSVSWAGYFALARKGLSDRRTRLFFVLGAALPIAFVAKDLLKWIFGRVDTRVWLTRSAPYCFHWFHGGRDYQGFPSGHLLVLTPLFVALWNFSLRARPLVVTAWLGLAAALLVTEYHFLGDVIAGTYVGYLIHGAIDRKIPQASGPSSGRTPERDSSRGAKLPEI